jgi:hypothetical protein
LCSDGCPERSGTAVTQKNVKDKVPVQPGWRFNLRKRFM